MRRERLWCSKRSQTPRSNDDHERDCRVRESEQSGTVTITIRADVSGFVRAMKRASESVAALHHAIGARMIADHNRRSRMHAAYRGKTRRRGRK